MGSLTMLNESGDTTIAWTEESDAAMEDIVRKKMAAGVTFFVVEPRHAGLVPARRTKLEDAARAREYRALAIPDEDLAAFVASGAGDAVPSTPEDLSEAKIERDPAKVARGRAVGVKPRAGG